MKTYIITLLGVLISVSGFTQKSFATYEQLMTYANTKSISNQSNDIKLLEAKKTKLAAKVAIFDPALNVNSSFINNTTLPVNVFPAEAFGGEKGTFREIRTGVQYNTTITQNLDVKLVNMEGWQNLKLAEINIAITENNAKLNLKSLHENIAGVYYNIVQLNEQLASTKQNLAVADTLLKTVENKYKQGIAKQQDVNDSRVNQLNIQENIRQIEYLINQNELSLKILADIPEEEEIEITEHIDNRPAPVKPLVQSNNLLMQSASLHENYALTNLQRLNKTIIPTLSFVANNSYNQFNNDFKIFGGKWINSNYVGLKLNWNLNTNQFSNKYKAQYDVQLAQKSRQQAQIKTNLTQKQLENDWEKANSQEKNNAEILAIQKDTYKKNLNLYNEGLIGIDRAINSFNAMVNANYSLISSKVNMLLAKTKIEINNQMN
jgi:outer membrane protein TolC